MKIQEIAGRRVKVSRSTISVLNDDGKTAGMITGVDTFYNMPPREQIEHAGKLRRLGIDRLKMDWRRMFSSKAFGTTSPTTARWPGRISSARLTGISLLPDWKKPDRRPSSSAPRLSTSPVLRTHANKEKEDKRR